MPLPDFIGALYAINSASINHVKLRLLGHPPVYLRRILVLVCWHQEKITPAEVEETMRLFDREDSWSGQQLEHLRNFLTNDDGKDFVMVKLLQLHRPVAESKQKLDAYQKIFLGSLLRKAGHPVLIAPAASGSEHHGLKLAALDKSWYFPLRPGLCSAAPALWWR